MLPGGHLARDDLEDCVFCRYVVMSRAAESQVVSLVGSSILAWMRPSIESSQVGQLAGLRLSRTSGQPCSRPTSSQTSLPPCPQGGRLRLQSINRPGCVDRRLKEWPCGSATRGFLQADLRAGGSAVSGGDYRNPSGQSRMTTRSAMACTPT
jgi:hypothetical protein